MGLLPELYAVRPLHLFAAHALSLVRGAVGGDKGDYTEVVLASGDFRVLVDPEPPQLQDLREARRAHTHEHPVLAHVLAGAPPEARKISDFMTRTEFHRSGLYGEFFSLLGVEDQLTVTISPLSSGRPAAISIDRRAPRFEETDRAVMECLRPHLIAARRNAAAFSAALHSPGSGDAPIAPGHSLERLTSRQLEVLQQLARGSTNAQIARELDLSTGTVRKHLEHILRRLEVTSRTAAAAVYLRAGQAAAPSAEWTAAEARMLMPATR